MKRENLTLDHFKEKYKKGLDGIYIYILDDCSLCIEYLKELEVKKTFENVYVVNCNEDVDYFMREFGLDNMPYTIVYKDGKELYERAGILFEKQIRDLKEALNNGNNSSDKG